MQIVNSKANISFLFWCSLRKIEFERFEDNEIIISNLKIALIY